MISMALVFILDSVNGRLTQLNIIQINTERDGGGAPGRRGKVPRGWPEGLRYATNQSIPDGRIC